MRRNLPIVVVSATAIWVTGIPSEDAFAKSSEVLDSVKTKLEAKPSYPVQEIGYWVRKGATYRLVDWIDNDRIIFVGGSFKDWDHSKVNPTAVYVFDIQNKTTTKLADGQGYCFKPNEIRYTLRQTPDEVVVRTITRGKESREEVESARTRTAIEAEGRKRKDRGYKSHPLYCGSYSPRELAGKNWDKYQLKGVFPLLEGHGFLDMFGRHPNSRRTAIRYRTRAVVSLGQWSAHQSSDAETRCQAIPN